MSPYKNLQRHHGIALLMLLLSSMATSQDDITTLTLMTYNIHVGIPMGHDYGKYTVTEADLRNISDVITSSGADVIAMQEVDCEFGLTLAPAKRRTFMLNEPRMLAAQTDMHYAFGSAQDDYKYPSDNAEYVEWGTANHWFNNGGRHGEVGNALLSRHRLAPPDNIALPYHAGKERRACLRTSISTDGQFAKYPPIVFYATHLQHDNAHSRAEQMLMILRRARLEKPDSLVFILGDLNHTARDSLRAQEETTAPDLLEMAATHGFHDLAQLYAESSGTSAGMTYPADKPVARIDFILCNRRLNVLESDVIDTIASDHLPVVITVQLPEVEEVAIEDLRNE